MTRRETIIDKGMQAERTRLSWNRTGLAIAVIAALLIRADPDTLWHHLPAIGMFAVAMSCFFYARRRYRAINTAVRTGVHSVNTARHRILAATALLPAIIALAGALTS